MLVLAKAALPILVILVGIVMSPNAIDAIELSFQIPSVPEINT